MKKLVILIALCLLSLGCAAFLSAWGASPIREMYVVDSLDNPFLVVLYSPFLFAIYLVIDWCRKSLRIGR